MPILVKLGDLGYPKETVRFLAELGIDDAEIGTLS